MYMLGLNETTPKTSAFNFWKRNSNLIHLSSKARLTKELPSSPLKPQVSTQAFDRIALYLQDEKFRQHGSILKSSRLSNLTEELLHASKRANRQLRFADPICSSYGYSCEDYYRLRQIKKLEHCRSQESVSVQTDQAVWNNSTENLPEFLRAANIDASVQNLVCDRPRINGLNPRSSSLAYHKGLSRHNKLTMLAEYNANPNDALEKSDSCLSLTSENEIWRPPSYYDLNTSYNSTYKQINDKAFDPKDESAVVHIQTANPTIFHPTLNDLPMLYYYNEETFRIIQAASNLDFNGSCSSFTSCTSFTSFSDPDILIQSTQKPILRHKYNFITTNGNYEIPSTCTNDIITEDVVADQYNPPVTSLMKKSSRESFECTLISNASSSPIPIQESTNSNLKTLFDLDSQSSSISSKSSYISPKLVSEHYHRWDSLDRPPKTVLSFNTTSNANKDPTGVPVLPGIYADDQSESAVQIDHRGFAKFIHSIKRAFT